MREPMITHRKYFSILFIMLVIVFMFVFTQVAKESISDYDVNAHAAKPPVSGSLRWTPEDGALASMALGTESLPAEGRYVLLLGDESNDAGRVVCQWCRYTKRNLAVRSSAQGCSPGVNPPDLILVDATVIDCGREEAALMALVEAGCDLLFCNLPGPQVIRAREGLRTLLGIREVRADSIEVEGIHLFEDFFLGGRYIYAATDEESRKRQDLTLEMPWYITLSGTKTYMVGMLEELLEDEEAMNEYFPGVIWRNSYKGANVFAVNGDYLSDITGLGILSAVYYEARPYDLYPVINAQNLVVVDYPSFAEENTEVIQKLYSRSPKALQQDIVWPMLLSMARRGGWKLTSFLVPQYDYQDGAEPNAENYQFYLQQFREVEAEAGISLRHSDQITLAEKVERDEAFYDSANSRYVYTAAYAEPSEFMKLKDQPEAAFTSEIRTVACEYRPDMSLVFYCDDEITGQSIIGDARTHTYKENVRLRGLETALGYSMVKIDIHDVLWTESEDTLWEKMSEKVTSNLDTWWKAFQAFDKTTLSESDRRVRTFLNLDYKERREDDRISLEIEGMEEECWFLLRTHGEKIAEIQGAEYERVERDAYLLHVLEDRVEIRLEKNRGVLKYTLPEED